MHIYMCYDEFSHSIPVQVYVILVIKLPLFITYDYMDLCIGQGQRFQVIGVQKIEVRIIEDVLT